MLDQAGSAWGLPALLPASAAAGLLRAPPCSGQVSEEQVPLLRALRSLQLWNLLRKSCLSWLCAGPCPTRCLAGARACVFPLFLSREEGTDPLGKEKLPGDPHWHNRLERQCLSDVTVSLVQMTSARGKRCPPNALRGQQSENREFKSSYQAPGSPRLSSEALEGRQLVIDSGQDALLEVDTPALSCWPQRARRGWWQRPQGPASDQRGQSWAHASGALSSHAALPAAVAGGDSQRPDELCPCRALGVAHRRGLWCCTLRPGIRGHCG